jgi:hypothetical protein
MSNVKNYSEPGGEKWVVGGEIEIAAGGKLTFQGTELKPAAVQADSVASTVAGTVADLNALIGKLKAAGLMASE